MFDDIFIAASFPRGFSELEYSRWYDTSSGDWLLGYTLNCRDRGMDQQYTLN